ncbi:CE1759 family FMN reductase [Streptomyces sp. TP-A0874]|uniref:CE1759 family FMN reductase n=1 Tax=Streptomyces sp. TP-A0874 TaxID=549819 RepID=UPI0008533327|nr:CE1759 family FMN reductase [Streptomyces sp. TP-A0874]
MTEIAVISGGLREPSSTRLLADRLAAGVRTTLEEHGKSVNSSTVELRPLGRSIMDATLSGFPSSDLENAFAIVAAADGVIAVTPAFNASFSGMFKMFFDVLPEGIFEDMPVLIGATGGTERHSLVLEHALRPMFSYLHAIVSPRGVYAATEDFGSQAADALGRRIAEASSDFARVIENCGTRQRRDPFTEDLSSMQRLLGSPGPRGGEELE